MADDVSTLIHMHRVRLGVEDLTSTDLARLCNDRANRLFDRCSTIRELRRKAAPDPEGSVVFWWLTEHIHELQDARGDARLAAREFEAVG